MTPVSESYRIRELALNQWDALQLLAWPPKSRITLWEEATRVIGIDNRFGPAVPYPAVPRTGSESNYGYVRLKGRLEFVEAIPELVDWPEYADFVRLVNGDSSPIESVGCAVGYFDADRQEQTVAKHLVGCYLDMVFTDAASAQNARAYIELSASFMAHMGNCEKWWTNCSMALQRLRYLQNAAEPLGVTLRIQSHGRTTAEAREMFVYSLQRVGNALRQPTSGN